MSKHSRGLVTGTYELEIKSLKFKVRFKQRRLNKTRFTPNKIYTKQDLLKTRFTQNKISTKQDIQKTRFTQNKIYTKQGLLKTRFTQNKIKSIKKKSVSNQFWLS